jgi:hypothetical protein
MRTLHYLTAGLRSAFSNMANRTAILLLVAGAALALPQPSAGQSGTWTETGDLITPRWDHTATLLPDGMVLVAGGFHSSSTPTSAELYDPASGSWTATGSLANGREEATATLLPDGKVLIAGGSLSLPTEHKQGSVRPSDSQWRHD